MMNVESMSSPSEIDELKYSANTSQDDFFMISISDTQNDNLTGRRRPEIIRLHQVMVTGEVPNIPKSLFLPPVSAVVMKNCILC